MAALGKHVENLIKSCEALEVLEALEGRDEVFLDNLNL